MKGGVKMGTKNKLNKKTNIINVQYLENIRKEYSENTYKVVRLYVNKVSKWVVI